MSGTTIEAAPLAWPTQTECHTALRALALAYDRVEHVRFTLERLMDVGCGPALREGAPESRPHDLARLAIFVECVRQDVETLTDELRMLDRLRVAASLDHAAELIPGGSAS